MNRCELKYLQYTDEKSSQIKRESYDVLGNKMPAGPAAGRAADIGVEIVGAKFY